MKSLTSQRGRPQGSVKVQTGSIVESLIHEETVQGVFRPVIQRRVMEELGVELSSVTIWKIQKRLEEK